MARNNTKKVTWRALRPGQEVEGWCAGTREYFARSTVKEANAAFVTLLVFGSQEERVGSEETTFVVELTRKEFVERYADGAAAVMRGIQNRLARYELGYHEMWNSWISNDPYDMAAECQVHEMRIVGHCDDIDPRPSIFFDEVWDVGICAEYETGDRIWCHASKEWLSNMIREYAHLAGEAEARSDG